MRASRGWVVTSSGDRPLRDLARDLTKNGFAVGRVLDEIGLITGTATDQIAKGLRSIPGVADVSPEDVADVGPPDAPVTW